MNTKVKLFLIIILLYIYFLTPQILSDTIYEKINGLIKLIYIDYNNNLISYTFNHKDYDGRLMKYSIQKELVKYKNENSILNIYDFKKFQYLNSNRILQFSKFTSSISYLLKEMLVNQKRKLKIGIFISIRKKIKNQLIKGNFIKFANFTIIPSDSIFDICLKCQTSIKNSQSKRYIIKNTTIHEFIFGFYNSDYIFNSWRDLSSIITKNNKLLIRKSTNKITEKDILNLKYLKDKKAVIFLDFFYNKYIISNIVNF